MEYAIIKIISIENGNIICFLKMMICPNNYYLKKSQNKCSHDTTELSNYFEFNKEYYNFCPPNTIDKEEEGAISKTCICDTYNYWYEDVDTHYLYFSLTLFWWISQKDNWNKAMFKRMSRWFRRFRLIIWIQSKMLLWKMSNINSIIKWWS